jgi:hypothetical protein
VSPRTVVLSSKAPSLARAERPGVTVFFSRPRPERSGLWNDGFPVERVGGLACRAACGLGGDGEHARSTGFRSTNCSSRAGLKPSSSTRASFTTCPNARPNLPIAGGFSYSTAAGSCEGPSGRAKPSAACHPPPTEEDSDGDMLGPALALGRPVPRELFDTTQCGHSTNRTRIVASMLFCEKSLRAAIPSSQA